jgi:hypothetical protein
MVDLRAGTNAKAGQWPTRGPIGGNIHNPKIPKKGTNLLGWVIIGQVKLDHNPKPKATEGTAYGH